MSWSYDPTLITTTQLFQVRFLVGDVLANDQQLQDEEINWAITQRTTVYGAAAYCCRTIAAQYSRRATTGVTGMNIQFSNQAAAYARRAEELEALAAVRGAAIPYAGGISESDKATQEGDGDRVGPQYTIGMDDNFLPSGSAETPETLG